MKGLETSYVGVYESDDLNSKKSCNTTLIFGEPQPNGCETVGADWKWVKLPCPHCKTTHQFKRSYWKVAIDLSWK